MTGLIHNRNGNKFTRTHLVIELDYLVMEAPSLASIQQP